MKKIKVQSLLSAIFRVDNSGDAERTCPIEADLTIGPDGVETIYNGAAILENGGRVTFHEYQSGESGIGFDNVQGTQQKITLMDEIDKFCKVAKEEGALLLSKTMVEE